MPISRPALLASIVGLAACTAQMGYAPVQPTDADQAMMKRAFMQNLADPLATQTADIAVFQAPNGSRMICGKMNAKNAFGGYIGFQTFVVTTVAAVDYSAPSARPIFGWGATAQIDCGGAGYR